MASFSGQFVCLAMVLCLVPALAVDYTVGDTSGWATGVDYDSWAKGKTFTVGDNLVFNYGGGHTVDEVSKSDYESCTTGNAITSDSTGATTVPLKTAGAHNFICGVVGHCGNGMKLSVTVAAGTPATGAPTSPTTTTAATPTTGSAPTNSGKTTPSAVPAGVSSAGKNSPAIALFVGFVGLIGW